MNAEDVSRLSGAAVAKKNLLGSDFMQYFFRAIMAGFFIDMAMIFSNVVNNVFAEGFPQWGKPLFMIISQENPIRRSRLRDELPLYTNICLCYNIVTSEH